MATHLRHPNRKAHNWLIYRILTGALLEHKDLFKGTVVDFGCGEAPYREYILETAERYIGVDWSESFHAIKADVVADLNKRLPIESAMADAVVSISVLEHLSDPQIMLKEAHRVLKPGGKLLLQVPWQWGIHEEPFDFFRFSPFGLQHLCEKAGFSRIEIKPMGGFFEMIGLKMNYFSLRFVRGPRCIRLCIRSALWPFWQSTQILSLILNKFDRKAPSEAAGYILKAERD